MNDLLKKLEGCSLNTAFKDWFKAQPLSGENLRNGLLALAEKARAEKFSGECQDWIRDRAEEVK